MVTAVHRAASQPRGSSCGSRRRGWWRPQERHLRRQLWLQLGLGSYKTAWRFWRSGRLGPGGRVAGQGRRKICKGRRSRKPGRTRASCCSRRGRDRRQGAGPGALAVIEDYSATTSRLRRWQRDRGSTVVSDGWSGYARLKEVKHDPKVVGPMAAHVLLPGSTGCSQRKRWALGVYHGLRAPICNAISTSSCSASIEGERPSGFASLSARRHPRPRLYRC